MDKISLRIDFATEDPDQIDEITKAINGQFKNASFGYMKAKERQICGHLSQNQSDLVRGAIKNKRIKFPLLRAISNAYDAFNEELVKAIISDAFGGSFYNLLNEKTEEDVIDFLATGDESFIPKADGLFHLLGFNGDTICKSAKFQRAIEKKVADRYEAQLKTSGEKAEAAKKEKEKLDEKIKDLNEELKQKEEAANKKDKEIGELSTELQNKKNELEQLKKNEREREKETEELLRKQIAEQRYISNDQLISTLQDHFFIGEVERFGINLSKNMIVVSSLNPLFPNADFINREEFESRVAHGNQTLLTFAHFIDEQLLNAFLPSHVDDFFYLSDAEKTRLLLEAFAGKPILFRPEFKALPGRPKLVKNAIIEQTINDPGFGNATYVPSLTITAKSLEELVKEDGTIINVPSYPAVLSQTLRYVLIGRTIYQVSFKPANPKDNLFSWRAASKECKKLGVLGSLEKTDYLQIPGSSDIYIKNIVLSKLVDHRHGQTISEYQLVEAVYQNALSKGLVYQKDDIANFHIALKSSSLVILAGPSGIGKTRLPLIYAETLGLYEENNPLIFVPISPSYLEPEDVLGFVRPISNLLGESPKLDDKRDEDEDGVFTAEFFESPTGLVSFLKEANESKDKMHIVIFDEMNLSQIEHWFAPFVSVLEKDLENRKLVLYSNKAAVRNADDYPASLIIGPNVFFVGTVNLDETTKPISDRLSDRAIVINLQKSPFDELHLLGDAEKPSLSEVTFSQFYDFVKGAEINAVLSQDEQSMLKDINSLLSKPPYFGGISYRTLKKMAIYLANSEGVLDRKEAFDIVLDQMIIRKIKGSDLELHGIISNVDTEGLRAIISKYTSISQFRRSLGTIWAKAENIAIYGYTR